MFENENELWKGIPHYPNYLLSNLGRLYSIPRDKMICPDNHGGVTLYNDSGHQGWSIQVLLGCVFLGNDIDDPCRNRVLFKDGNSSNLVLDNLYIEDTSTLPGEIWKPLTEAAGRLLKDFYQVSNVGRIKSVKHYVEVCNHGKIVKKPCPELLISCVPQEHGYLMAYLACEDGTDVNAQVHRLVAAAFCPNDDPEHKDVVNHKDGNPSNNKADNLEWCTPAENAQHAVNTGLRGNWKGRKLRYTVLHVEADKIYDSLSDVDRALGRRLGYCSDCLELGKPVKDRDGNVWTLQVFKDITRKISTDGQHCTIEEFPGKEFISLSEASAAIGRWEGYISDSLKRGSAIRNKAGQVMHIHLIGDAPVVSVNVAYQEKKAAGLIKPKKEPHYVCKSNIHQALRHLETGEIYSSFSAASKAMGRCDGYVGECFAYDRDCIDINGSKWTFELIEKGSVTLHYRKNACRIDEFPEKEFANFTEASEFIGRNGGYINDRIHFKKPILTPDGQLLHFHFIDPEKEAKLQSEYYSQVNFNEMPKVKHKKLFKID